MLLIRTIGKNFSEISTEIYTFSFKKMHLKMSSGKWRPFCLSLNVLMLQSTYEYIDAFWWGGLVFMVMGSGHKVSLGVVSLPLADQWLLLPHDDVRHQMETFSALLALCAGNSPVTIPHTKASDAELWCFLRSTPWTNGWVNNRTAGDFRRHRAHYYVIVIK